MTASSKRPCLIREIHSFSHAIFDLRGCRTHGLLCRRPTRKKTRQRNARQFPCKTVGFSWRKTIRLLVAAKARVSSRAKRGAWWLTQQRSETVLLDHVNDPLTQPQGPDVVVTRKRGYDQSQRGSSGRHSTNTSANVNKAKAQQR